MVFPNDGMVDPVADINAYAQMYNLDIIDVEVTIHGNYVVVFKR